MICHYYQKYTSLTKSHTQKYQGENLDVTVDVPYHLITAKVGADQDRQLNTRDFVMHSVLDKDLVS